MRGVGVVEWGMAYTCPKCQRQLKLTTMSELTDQMPYVWKCACGLYATEKDEDFRNRRRSFGEEPDKKGNG